MEPGFMDKSVLAQFPYQSFAKDLEQIRDQCQTDKAVEIAAKCAAKRAMLRSGLFVLAIALSWSGVGVLAVLCFAASGILADYLGHAIMHGGYEQAGLKGMKRNIYQNSWRKYLDYNDWRHPGSWDLAHNQLHHYFTNSDKDLDLITQYDSIGQYRQTPYWLRYLYLLVTSPFFWTLWYMPIAYQAWFQRQQAAGQIGQEQGEGPTEQQGARRMQVLFSFRTPLTQQYWRDVMIPNGSKFVFLPLLAALIQPLFGLFVLLNMMLGEGLRNMNAWFSTTVNHHSPQASIVRGKSQGKGQWYYQQIVTSANYGTGKSLAYDLRAFFLNYQIEHHLFPKMPPELLPEVQPQVEKLCKQYGVCYINRKGFFVAIRELFQSLDGSVQSPVLDWREVNAADWVINN